MTPPDLAVVVPALDESSRIAGCLTSLVDPGVRLQVRVSDNASQDGTARLATSFAERLDLQVRTIERLPATPHFVSAGRWGLQTSDASCFALLAGDDSWDPGFARVALAALSARPDVDAVFPAFRWAGGATERLLAPADFTSGSGRLRQARALVMSDRRELANLVYGVYRRDAFQALLDAWARGGDSFGSDFAAVWAVLGRHRAVAVPQAVGVRHERPGADLLSRVGITAPDDAGPVRLATTYVALNLRVNALLGDALERVADEGWTPGRRQTQLLRAPQWVWGAGRHVANRSAVA